MATPTSPDPAPQAVRKPMAGRLHVGLAVGAAAAIVLIFYGWHWWQHGRFMEDTDDAYVGGDITVISAKVPGYIAAVQVTDNQFVHAGDLLAKLDDSDYRAALARAEGGVAARQAEIANLEATRAVQTALIAQARAGVDASQAELVRAQDDDRRFERLVDRAAVSVRSAQKAAADFRQAAANSQKAQAGLAVATRQLEVIQTRRQQAEAGLAQARAEREAAQLNLRYTELRAPIDGVVGNRRARTGAYAATASQLMVIVPARGLWIDANFKESQLAGIRPGNPATVEADAIPGRVFHGHVASVAPATGAQFSVLPPENATGNFTKIVQRVPVRILLDSADGVLDALRPGLSVVARVDRRGQGS
ncbi:HlyD family secretion protein [Herbaspirillum sp. C9C3]|uniref:HlyD family secretion protein n=1 Tax=Herbaspirillum sp. C9C3 TaxID=2735271 RepID=UPI001585A34D|nr:HlyD family secretion protein [Herbaspirillum sp. C9C3]NUT62249.1 HlyD family secretion protein [Herbaspirillum sp. C9C3]